ncbi:RagB/SusD family nutrient uptake outer membrane protein [Pedobacter hiemivivus]|uniref:RagB/SusD family nutrient uptake outer membrane protein n=1 Tax=Pedobacter hiemivivus TaxID=2530454 RepID=A0A4U1GBQ8_9SPHI|nr:RagB/SusD family nutrient uptake outer membrane protein [Pedobacter hiemivivus]TKC58572.1 RagB/SusD family nutrient uptake outer membrane protein [Pedobacter hiemivivus]
MNSLKFKNIVFFTVLLVISVGCKKFLAERSQTLQYVNNFAQLDELLVGEGYMAHSNAFTTGTSGKYLPWLNVMDDDITEFATGSYVFDSRQPLFGFYTWQSKPFVNYLYAPYTDDTWAKFYKHINATNIIAKKATELNDNPTELKRILGEALFLRAGYYFYMINIYAKAYNPATAKTDLGVPLKITEFVDANLATRATVEQVYQQIVADLAEAEQALSDVPQKSLYHADVNAVNLLQSRIYLYMQDWENAATAAKKVIARKNTLYNLATYQPKTSFFTSKSPEAIFTQGTNIMMYLMYENGLTTFRPSDELIQLYGMKDLRRTTFFEIDPKGKYRYTKVYRSTLNAGVTPEALYSDNFFMRNAEAYLNLAEASAMLQGKEAEANTALNTLRRARFLPQDYQETNLTGTDLVSFIRDERRRELCFEGHRWFDLRRYAVNQLYPYSKTIVHPYSNTVQGNATLAATLTLLPNDPAYLIPLPDPAIEFNKGQLLQNPDRPNRAF